MTDDLLATVTAAVEKCGTGALKYEYQFNAITWLRALVARCTTAEADLAALRERHAVEVEKAFREGRVSGKRLVGTDDEAWLKSWARLT